MLTSWKKNLTLQLIQMSAVNNSSSNQNNLVMNELYSYNLHSPSPPSREPMLAFLITTTTTTTTTTRRRYYCVPCPWVTPIAELRLLLVLFAETGADLIFTVVHRHLICQMSWQVWCSLPAGLLVCPFSREAADREHFLRLVFCQCLHWPAMNTLATCSFHNVKYALLDHHHHHHHLFLSFIFIIA